MDIRDEIELNKAMYPEWGSSLDEADARITLAIWEGMKAAYKEPTPPADVDREK